MPAKPLQQLLHRLRRLAGHPTEGGLSDGELLDRFIRTRDEAAFELLLWRHGALVFGLCRRLLRHEQDAEDAFQATFLTLARKAGSIRKRAAVASWLYKVAYRIAVTARRDASIRAACERPAGHELPAVEPDASAGELRPVLDEEVQRLPEKYRAAFVLCCLEGKTNAEAAELLGCPKGTVLSRLSRARERLRKRLTRRGVVGSAGLSMIVAESASAATISSRLVAPTIKAALAVAAGQTITAAASGPVAALTEGAIRAMFVSKLKIAAAIVLAVSIFSAGVAGVWALTEEPRTTAPAQKTTADTARQGKPPEDPVQAARQRVRTKRNLQAIVRGLTLYAEMNNGRLPPPAVVDKNGKPLYSWRVLILPYMGYTNLYKMFHFDEPWDSEHNKIILNGIPDVYAAADAPEKNRAKTYFQALVGPGAGFETGKQLRFPADFTDGLSNTIAVVEAATPVPWTKPEDLPYDPEKPLPKFGGPLGGDFNAAFWRGEVRLMSKKADETQLRNVITRAGGEVMVFDAILASAIEPDPRPDADELVRANARLREALEKTLADVEKAKNELTRLQLKAGTAKTAVKENAALKDALDKALDELDALREQISRLRK